MKFEYSMHNIILRIKLLQNNAISPNNTINNPVNAGNIV